MKKVFHLQQLPTANGFVQWRNNHVVYPIHNFIYDLLFNLLLGMKCYRADIRLNNSTFALCGKQKVTLIMFTGKHDTYQPLIMNDMRIRVEAPTEVKLYIKHNESFDHYGDHFREECGDYVTEIENKYLKSHLSPGVPTLNSWVVASRNHKTLKSNRDAVLKTAKLKDPGLQQSSIFKFSKEVQRFRVAIREPGMLNNPFEDVPMRSIDGDLLHHDLFVEILNVYFQSKDNYKAYKIDPESELLPVFVAYAEEKAFNNVKNWTIAKLKNECEKFIKMFSDSQNSETFLALFTKLKRSKKLQLIQFYEN